MEDQLVVTSIPEVPVTVLRRPFVPSAEGKTLAHPGVARANIAATYDQPNGTTKGDWAKEHRHQTVLQQHCEFFDRDRDGVIWPMDTFWGFHRLGFGVFLSLLSLVIIHVNFSYATSPSWIPDPFFRVHMCNIHKAKHGSDSDTYDHEGRFSPQKFEDMFTKYAGGKETMTFWDVVALLQGQRLVSDPIGWCGAIFEWSATYIMLWPEDGHMKKEDIRAIYDGSMFHTMVARRARKKGWTLNKT